MNDYFLNPLVFLVQILFGFYIGIVLIRFALQWVRADFYNPISQFVTKVTSPVLRPLRRFIPGYRGLDLASLVLAWVLQLVELLVLALLLGQVPGVFGLLIWSIPALISRVIFLLLFLVFVRAILSWFNPDPYHPGADIIRRLTDPLLRPAQRFIPPIAGIDLSPMVVIVLLYLLNMLLVPVEPLRMLLSSGY